SYAFSFNYTATTATHTLSLHDALPIYLGQADKPVIPDYAAIHRELSRKGVTLMLLWQEYQANHLTQRTLQYSQFCERYRQYAKTLKRSMGRPTAPGVHYGRGPHARSPPAAPSMDATAPDRLGPGRWPGPGIERTHFLSLALGEWVQAGQTLILTGATLGARRPRKWPAHRQNHSCCLVRKASRIGEK